MEKSENTSAGQKETFEEPPPAYPGNEQEEYCSGGFQKPMTEGPPPGSQIFFSY